MSKTGIVVSLGVLLIIGVLIWSFADQGTDTGTRVTAKVLECQGGLYIPRSCVLQFENTHAQEFVYLQVSRAGDDIVFAKFYKPLSGQTYYTLP